MPPRPFALKIITDAEQLAPGPAGAPAKHDPLRDSWEVKPDGTCALLGRSLKGDYVFSAEGLVRAAGQDAPPHYRVCESDIMFLRPLGAGACATVHKGYHKGLRRFVAVKRVGLANKELRHQVLRDIRVLSDTAAVPGLTALLGAYMVPRRDQMAVVLEYMDGGTLADAMGKLGRLPEGVVATIAGRLLQGLAFMHSRHMVHRDVKPANVLLSLSGGGEAKLSDFGISAVVDHTLAQCMTYAGTVTYMSPERLEAKPYNFAADIWSLGLVLVEALTGRYPYDASGGPVELIIHVLQGEPPLPPPGSVSDLCRDFLAACLARDPSRRPAAAALLGHPWVAQAAPVNLRALLRGVAFHPDDKLDEVSCHFSFTFYSLLSAAHEEAAAAAAAAEAGADAGAGARARCGGGGEAAAGGDQAAGGRLGQLAALYLDHSVLSHQGCTVHGRAAILAQLEQPLLLPPPAPQDQQQQQQQMQQQQQQGWRHRAVRWEVTAVDSQTLLETGCVMVHVHGRLDAAGALQQQQQGQMQHQMPPPPQQQQQHQVPGRPAALFAESFILARTPQGEYYVANQAFRLLPQQQMQQQQMQQQQMQQQQQQC